ncbi:MAG: hypothetical protein R2684_03750 [Pyrinomonadaceae bacterium]
MPNPVKLLFLAFVLLFAFGCAASEPSNSNTENGAVKPDAVPTRSERETEISSLKNADFDYIYVLKRKDGKALDVEDKRFVKAKAHFATNRFSLSTNEKTLYIGSNYAFEAKSLKDLNNRFELEDLSKSKEQIEKEKSKLAGNSNSNSNTNTGNSK